MTTRRRLLQWTAGSLAAAPLRASAADETVTVGVILPLSGPMASVGRQVAAGIRLSLHEGGTDAGSRKLNVVIRDDTANPEITKRLAQEFIVNDKAALLAGFGLTPLALAVAPLSTKAKIPQVIMVAGTSMITERAPYSVRVSFTLPQMTVPLVGWAYGNGIRKVASLVSDYGPGLDSEKAFADEFTRLGGVMMEKLRVPLASPDFSPLLQRIKDARPDAIFLFTPAGQGAGLMRQLEERGMREAGIKVIATGDVTDDDQLNGMGKSLLGVVTSHNYSAAHPSPENRAFVAAFKKANDGMRPNFLAVSGYDGMNLIRHAVAAVAQTDGDALLDAMKGQAWTSPRGPISIDKATRDIVQNVYIRKVEEVDGELYNVEFATIPDVKDPLHPA